jgi:hypothetical protein
MFAKHLPPSADLPRVLALDDDAARALPAEVELTRGDANTLGEYDAVVGHTRPENLDRLMQRLRPGGRLILAAAADAQVLLTALTAAGFIHCLVEAHGDVTLYRGERPPLGSSLERLHTLNTTVHLTTPFVFLLILQTPNKPAWRLTLDEKIEWHALTVLDPETGQPILLAFSSLVKAVAFMQAAILNHWLRGVNKVGKFQAEVAKTWTWPFVLNPDFELMRGRVPGPLYAVDVQTALTDEA